MQHAYGSRDPLAMLLPHDILMARPCRSYGPQGLRECNFYFMLANNKHIGVLSVEGGWVV
ncbi:hypothetical protein NEOLEDRAFT_1126783 [Neolentinus lepideus HHB14362 ss-1]|uniref:Uncharacterized protein n=1 Tax=Neolentinus lepideus HHB14362 ss-1 TaxID=1314782 RepID=A0A165VQH6_9AGAM|nr:hypothetical protein NEOLEDRAFT_1126783 [Neolentinus lepideus HHB14362 ss-1]